MSLGTTKLLHQLAEPCSISWKSHQWWAQTHAWSKAHAWNHAMDSHGQLTDDMRGQRLGYDSKWCCMILRYIILYDIASYNGVLHHTCYNCKCTHVVIVNAYITLHFTCYNCTLLMLWLWCTCYTFNSKCFNCNVHNYNCNTHVIITVRVF